ncbi:hypothetical protein Tco_1316157 [Tanacetum coccineum]
MGVMALVNFFSFHTISERRLVSSCCVIFNLEPLLLSFDFVFSFEIFNRFLVCLCRLCHLVILFLDQHAHSLHHLESLLTISLDNLCLDNLDIFKEDLEYHNYGSLYSKNLLDRVSSCTSLLSLPERLKADNTIRVIESSIHLLDQNPYPVDTRLIHIESRKSPTAVLFDDDTGRISIRLCEY